MFADDKRIDVVPHPVLGKTCITTRDVKRHERFYFWGKDMGLCEDTDSDRYLTVCDESTTIDPEPFQASKLQFVNAPGPDETFNLTPSNKIFYKHGLVSQSFRATCNIPKGMQLSWDYGSDDWFTERSIRRINIGTQTFPARRKT